MKLFKCDICGDHFEPVYEGEFEGRHAVAVGFMTMADFDTRNKTFDVCPLCMNDIETLIDTRRKNK